MGIIILVLSIGGQDEVDPSTGFLGEPNMSILDIPNPSMVTYEELFMIRGGAPQAFQTKDGSYLIWLPENWYINDPVRI
jgi:hypothetical protein